MLKVTQTGRKIEIQTGGAIFEWDLARGGQIVRCDVKTAAGVKPLLSGGQLAGNLTLDLGAGVVSLANNPVEVEFGRHDEHCYVFSTKSRLGHRDDLERWEGKGNDYYRVVAIKRLDEFIMGRELSGTTDG